MHRFGSYLNSHVHFHVLVTDGVFSAGVDGEAIFHQALDLEQRLARYCARPPLSQERLGRLNEQTLIYSLRRPTADGRTELQLTPIELLDLLAQLVTPPRLHKHRYCGVLAPNAALREAVTASAGPAGATLQLLERARRDMGLPEPAAATAAVSDPPSPLTIVRRAAARCWACCWCGSTNAFP